MNIPIVLKSGDTTSWHKVIADGRYLTLLECDYQIEINYGNELGFADIADEIDFGEVFQNGVEIRIRNTSENENSILFAFSGFYIRRKTKIELTADGAEVAIAENEIVGINPALNTVKVVNQPTIAGSASTLPVAVQGNINVGNFPATIQVSNFPDAVGASGSQYGVTTESFEFDGNNAWLFSNGQNSRLIFSGNKGVKMDGNYVFASGLDLVLNDMAPQVFGFTGEAGQTVTVIKMALEIPPPIA